MYIKIRVFDYLILANTHAMGSMSAALVVAAGILIIAGAAVAELTPPYFNLAEGRQISATATCGVDTEEPELYCKLVGANTETYNHSKLIQGQVSLIIHVSFTTGLLKNV